MPGDRKRLVLVDGSSYLYRAFHAMPSLMNSGGEPTGAAYGITNMLKRLMADHDPDFVAVVFDARGRTFRDDLYDAYKANRPPMPEDLAVQVAPIHAIVRALGLPLIEVPGVEADDVIGTLARHASASGIDVVISSSDKDLAQLVDERVTLENTMDGRALDRDGVAEKYGVAPERIIDLLALVGDTSDNVPGVPKVGPKTAAKWLAAYDTLDGVVEHADEIKGKAGENLRGALDQLALSRELVTIKCDVVLDDAPSDLVRGAVDDAALRELYSKLEFKTWLAEIIERSPESEARAEAPEYDVVVEAAGLDAWIERLRGADLIAFDTETTSLDYMSARLVGVSFAVAPGEAAYVPFGHVYAGAPPQLDREHVLERLRPLLEDPTLAKVGQNLKYDSSVLALDAGIELAGARFDTMLESYVVDSTATRHDMDSLALKYLGHRTIHYEDVAGKGAKQLTFDQVPVEQAGPYAAEDADVTLRLHEVLRPKLEAEPALARLHDEIEMPLVPVLSRVERNGVRVDRALLVELSREFETRMAQTEQEAYDLAGGPFNLGSSKQIQTILFENRGLPVLAKTPKGAPSTAESVLQELADRDELPRLILAHRALAKLKSTYTDALATRIHPTTGRVHTSYHQAVASTGRLSSSEPNLQNIPIRTAEGRRIRQAFVPETGYRLVAADYSQIELRIMAHLSGDEGLRRAFAAGEDVHRATAGEVFGAAPEAVSDDQRRSAKAINFGLIYGMSAFGLARQLGIERGEAQAYVELYFDRYPGVKRFMDETRERAQEQGYVETVFGRRLYLPEIRASNAQRRQYAERTAINAPMQGTAADIIKRAMIRLDRWLAGCGLDARMIMQVHDELVFEVGDAHVDEACAAITGHMEAAADLAVPLEVDVGVGGNWDEAH